MNANNFRKFGCGAVAHDCCGCRQVATNAVGPFKAVDVGHLNPPTCAIQTKRFINSTAIIIPTFGQATPYPSPIIVSGMTGKIIEVTVNLFNFNHTAPDDIDIMLVGPQGQNATILSDIGGRTPAIDVNLTLNDLAPMAISPTAPLVSGTFKPTNSGLIFDVFPGAPSPSGGPMLSSFNFTDPNGIWSLYVDDDAGVDAGSIANGWALTITTSNCTP